MNDLQMWRLEVAIHGENRFGFILSFHLAKICIISVASNLDLEVD